MVKYAKTMFFFPNNLKTFLQVLQYETRVMFLTMLP